MKTTPTIALNLTPQEAAWLRDSLNIAQCAYAQVTSPREVSLRKWCSAFARGLDAKINELEAARD